MVHLNVKYLMFWTYFVFSTSICILCQAESLKGIKEKPNFLIIVADDLGIGDIGCFGNTTLLTPNVDRIAREGAQLMHNLAAAEICTPSRAAIMTGRYPVRSGMTSSYFNRVLLTLAEMGGLPPSEITYSTIAKQQGYSTALIGKWHLGLHCRTAKDFCHHPNNHGFDYFYGLPWSTAKDFGRVIISIDRALPHYVKIIVSTACVGFLTAFWLLRQKRYVAFIIMLIVACLVLWLLFLTRNLHLLNGVMMRNKVIIEQPVTILGLVNRFVDEAENYLIEQVKKEQAFMLMFTFTHVHTALAPTPAFQGASNYGIYGDSVLEMDWAVGRLLDTLDKLQLAENTFVLFTSDQGGHVEEKGPDGSRHGGYNGIYRGGKGMGGMDGALRVPTVIRWPNRIKPGTTLDIPTSLMDVFPTILSVMNASLPNDRIIDGKNLLPLLTAAEEEKDTHKFLVHYCGKLIHAARFFENDSAIWKAHFIMPNWLPGTQECKYLCPCQGDVTYYDPPLIYNIAQDPSEKHPLPINDLKVKEMLTIIQEELKIHKKSLRTVTDQFSILNTMWLPWLQPCCKFPYCSCVEKRSHINISSN